MNLRESTLRAEENDMIMTAAAVRMQCSIANVPIQFWNNEHHV